MSALLALLTGCAGPDRSPHRPGGDAPGVLVLAGGGAEGEPDDEAAWSTRAYGALLEGGDVTGDGVVSVAVVSAVDETAWLPRAFRTLGADDAVNLRIADRRDAADADLSGVDAVFLKGGDQGVYYDAWAGTAFADALVDLHARGGGLGGTSAGAMSLAGLALAGGKDLVSADVLGDACTEWLDDADGGSALHDDFLGLVPGVIVDTHVTVRGRLGRMVGTLAKAVDDGLPARGVLGLDERTALVVRDGVGEVVGVGAVTWVRPGDAPPTRRCGRPLAWAGLSLDALVDGWTLDLATGEATPGPRATAVAPAPPPVDNAPGAWSVDGGRPADEERFGVVVTRGRDPYGVRDGTAAPVQQDTVGVLDAHAEDRRGPAQEALLAALADRPGLTGFVLGDGGRLARDGLDVVRAAGDLATLALDAGPATARDASPERSTADPGVRAAGLLGLRLAVLADGAGWDTRAHAPAP